MILKVNSHFFMTPFKNLEYWLTTGNIMLVNNV